jgi:hypothetical protein
MIDKTDDLTIFKSKQVLMDMVVHSGDLSFSTRSFDVVQNWTYLLFDEFFGQGDMEEAQGYDISFLCDRNTV